MLSLAILAGQGFSLVLGGDLMFNGVGVTGRSLEGIAGITKPAGLAFANLEIPLTNMTRPTPNKSAADIAARNQYVLKGDPRHAPEIKAAGFDAVSLGNNHAMDYRLAGLDQMRASLDKLGIPHTGAGANLDDARKLVVVRAPDGTRVGLLSSLAFMSWGGALACTPAAGNKPGVNYLRFNGKIDDKARAELLNWIGAAKARCDVLVVALHWGIERQPVPSSYQVALGRACIDAGADLVWGHHPHVLQGAELYKNKPILYSMGNLVSPTSAQTGLIRLYWNGKWSAARFFPATIDGGRVRLSGSKTQSAEFMNRCSRLRRAYPSPDSQPMPWR